MSNTNKPVKVYRNPARAQQDPHQPYTPQYQLMGIEPEVIHSASGPGMKIAPKVPLPNTNPRAPRLPIRQPYAEAVQVSPIGRGQLPNVGNNMEQSWSAVDTEIIDDLSNVAIEGQMIDNNEYVSASALGLPDDTQEQLPMLDEVKNPQPKQFADQSNSIFQDLEEGDYLLMVNNQPMYAGSLSDIEMHARNLVFGEDEALPGTTIPIDDLVVLKRVKIKVGLFLE